SFPSWMSRVRIPSPALSLKSPRLITSCAVIGLRLYELSVAQASALRDREFFAAAARHVEPRVNCRCRARAVLRSRHTDPWDLVLRCTKRAVLLEALRKSSRPLLTSGKTNRWPSPC